MIGIVMEKFTLGKILHIGVKFWRWVVVTVLIIMWTIIKLCLWTLKNNFLATSSGTAKKTGIMIDVVKPLTIW